MTPRENETHLEPSAVPREAGAASPPPPARPDRLVPGAPLDRETLERVRARDPEALGRFFDRYFDAVFGLVHRLLGDRMLAEDVTSDVFLKIHRSAHQLDATRDPAPWLYTIATNACRDVWRSGAYRMARRSDDIHDEAGPGGRLAGSAPDPQHELLLAERERAVRGALAALPAPLRESIVLHDYQGLSHQEIAAIAGIEYAAARKRYSRALAALARRLQGIDR